MNFICIDATHGCTRLALLWGNTVVELQAVRADSPAPRVGDVYCGRVRVVQTNAAYVDIGWPQLAYWPLDGRVRQNLDGTLQNLSESDVQKPRVGEVYIFELASIPDEGHKGARVTRILLRGQQPDMQQGQSSGLLQRQQPHMEQTQPPELQQAQPPQTPGLLRAADPIASFLAAHAADGMRVEATTPEVVSFCQEWLQNHHITAECAQAPLDLFHYKSIDLAFERLFHAQVHLPCGGSLYFEKTRAAWMVDVDSAKFAGKALSNGKTVGKGIPSGEETITDMEDSSTDSLTTAGQSALMVNTQAAKQVMAQLRLRRIGGSILVDLLNMERAQDAQTVLETLRKVAALDPVPTKVLGINGLGMAEITRHRCARPVAQCIGVTTREGLRMAAWFRALMLATRAEAMLVAGAEGVPGAKAVGMLTARVEAIPTQNQTVEISAPQPVLNEVRKLLGDAVGYVVAPTPSVRKGRT